MNIIGIVGSKRKNGNTACLVKEALKGAGEEGAKTRVIYLGDYTIEDCRGCEGCRDTLKCVIDDGMQQLYPLLLECDGLILGSPVYFYNVTAGIKAFIDRCYCHEIFDSTDRSCWISVHEASGGKYAGIIVVGEQHDEKYMGFAAEAMQVSLDDLGFRVVDVVKGAGFWGPGEVLGDQEILKRAKKMGMRVAKTLKLRKEVQAKLSTAGLPGR